ncbi:MAG TPA: redoxin domain-containing protein [Bacteroidota bacterium]|nr:redoxin domain-containing protein [Bacteroidota bacterium]
MKIIAVLLSAVGFLTAASAQLTNPDTLFALAQRYHSEGMNLSRLGKKEEARKQLNFATEKFRDFQDGLKDRRDSVIKIFEGLREGSPQSPVYNYLLGRFIQISAPDSARSVFAIQCLNKAVEAAPDYPWSYLALAFPYFSKGDYTTASRFYEQSLAADSTFLFGYQQLITAYQKLGRSRDVARVETLLNARLPRSTAAIKTRLEKARQSADVETKIAAFREAIALSEDDELSGGIYTELLTALDGMNPGSALLLSRDVLTKPGAQYRKARQTAWFILLKAAKKKGESEVNDLADGMMKTEDAHVLRTMGRYYFDTLKNDERALKLFERAYAVCKKENALNTLVVGSPITDHQLEEVANNYRVWVAYDVGRTYLNLKKYAEAKQYLSEAAVGTATEHVFDANFKLASIFQEEKDKPNAVKWLSNGLSYQDNEAMKKELVRLIGSEGEATTIIEKLKKTNAPVASDFKLISIDGDSLLLSSLRGKVVLLDFWATWCGPCLREMPHLQKLAEKYAPNADVKFLSVSTDNPRDPVKPFIEKYKYSMKILYDDGISYSYSVRSIPSLFVIDRNGKIQYKHIGFGGNGEEFIKLMSGQIEELLAETQ